jgi:purine-binding chemotaxis protein CheW
MSIINSVEEKKEFLTMNIAGQLFGMLVNSVSDVLTPQKIIQIPLAPKEVIGSFNLRGRIVTAIDLRVILGIKTAFNLKECMGVVVEYNNDLYSFIVESVGEVLSLSLSEFTHNPENLSKNWQDLSLGIYPLKDDLLVILNINKVLQNISEDNANK